MRYVKIIGFSLLALLVLIGVYFIFGNYSSGSRAGTIVKLSRRGNVVKTYEGQLNLGGFTVDAGSPATSLWDFSVDNSNNEVIQQLEQASLNGRRVKLYYREKFYRLPWRGETKYFVYQVETAPQQ